ncbi:MAG: T9SS type A sorting domain-containing protein [Candidatus Hatepunaea meridiana]|nr:T9SS type A sorting domain-containing protein [Candidatus Hatepunaea meridiana]
MIWDEGNIDIDPLFLSLYEGDFDLTPDSPCIDAGIAFFIHEEDTLVNMSEDEYYDEAPDIGIHESNFNSVQPESGNPPNAFFLSNIYPNPFNSSVTITFGLSRAGQTSLHIYNLAGQRMKTLFEGHRQVGIYSQNLDARGLPSGLYFVRLKASDQVITQKVMLIR